MVIYPLIQAILIHNLVSYFRTHKFHHFFLKETTKIFCTQK